MPLTPEPKTELTTIESRPDSINSDADDALAFIRQAETSIAVLPAIDERVLLRKIDWRIIPILALCGFIQLLDRINLNYANVMGLSEDLKLRGNQFSWAVSGWSFANLTAELSTSWLLHKVPIGKTLGIMVILWGVITACTAAAHNFAALLVTRICLGISEAVFGPIVILVISMWYTKSEQAFRFGICLGALGLGPILGGVLSFGLQCINTPFASWRILFLALGGVSIALGVYTYIALPDTPMSSQWLSAEERLFAIKRLTANQTGIHNQHFNLRQLMETLLDPQYWLLFLLVVGPTLSTGLMNSFSATLIASYGFDSKQAALLNMPGGLVMLITMLLSSYAISRNSHRWLWIVLLALPGIVGGILTCYLPMTNKAGLLIGIYLINSIASVITVVYILASANVAGYTKKCVLNSTLLIAAALGNIISPLSFRVQDAPRYLLAKRLVLGSQAGTAVVAIILRLYYGFQNAARNRRARAAGIQEDPEEKAWFNRIRAISIILYVEAD